MTNIFRIDSPFMQFMTKLFDMVILNIIFLIFCIPIITIGASCTALHTMTLKIIAGDEPYIIKEFIKAFRKNFVQSTISWIILFLAGGFLYVDSLMAIRLGTGGFAIKMILGIASVIYFVILLYIFPIQARYKNTLSANYKNALLVAIRYLPKTILLALSVIVPVIIVLYGPVKVFLLMLVCFLLIGASFITTVQDKIILKIFQQNDESKI